MTDKLYTTDEVAEFLQVHRRTIYNYIKSGKLEAVKVGKSWRISEEALQKFLTSNS